MNRLTKLISPALVAAVALTAAVPASAAPWVQDARQLRNEIVQLDRQIDRAEHRRLLSTREANQLERKVENLKDLHARYARNGFTRAELRILDQRIEIVKRQVQREIADRDSRRNSHWSHDHRDYNRR